MTILKSPLRLTACVVATMLYLAAPAKANVIERLSLNNVGFEGVGAAVGYLDFDFTTNSVVEFDITTTTRIAGSFPFGFHYASSLLNAVATYTPVPPTSNLCTGFPAYNQVKIAASPIPTYTLDLRFMPPSWGSGLNPVLFARDQIATCAIFGSGEDGFSVTNFIVSGTAVSSALPETPPSAPEPATLAILGSGLIALWIHRCKPQTQR